MNWILECGPLRWFSLNKRGQVGFGKALNVRIWLLGDRCRCPILGGIWFGVGSRRRGSSALLNKSWFLSWTCRSPKITQGYFVEKSSHSAYEFLYKAYNQWHMYWEAVVMLWKRLLAIIVVLAISMGSILQRFCQRGWYLWEPFSWLEKATLDRPTLAAFDRCTVTHLIIVSVFYWDFVQRTGCLRHSCTSHSAFRVLIAVLLYTFIFVYLQLLTKTLKN